MLDQPIPNTSDGRACEHCRFADVVAIDPTSLKKVRVCRRFPPVPLVQFTANGPGFDSRFPNAHPMVHDTHWCHEFAATLPEALKLTTEKPSPKLIQN